MQTTLFKNGGSQAMRIPAQFRFQGETVDVEWDESLNALIVRQDQTSRMNMFFDWLDKQPPYQIPSVVPLTPEGRLDVGAFMDMDEVVES